MLGKEKEREVSNYNCFLSTSCLKSLFFCNGLMLSRKIIAFNRKEHELRNRIEFFAWKSFSNLLCVDLVIHISHFIVHVFLYGTAILQSCWFGVKNFFFDDKIDQII